MMIFCLGLALSMTAKNQDMEIAQIGVILGKIIKMYIDAINMVFTIIVQSM